MQIKKNKCNETKPLYGEREGDFFPPEINLNREWFE